MATKVLLVSLGFAPNIGGLETHLSDLVESGEKRGISFVVLTYQPLTTKVSAPIFEHKSVIEIIRLPVLGKFFYSLVNIPVLELAYLLPGLFFFTPILLIKHPGIKTIHTHGLIAGLSGLLWAKLFKKKIITTTHSNYSFVKGSLFSKMAKFLFSHSDVTLCLSKFSQNELVALGVNRKKTDVFTYWIDLENFVPKIEAKNTLKWTGFTVLFVGRLVEEKGVQLLASAARYFKPNIRLYIAGSGPLYKTLAGNKRLSLLGPVSQNKLPGVYSAASVVIVPSTHEEGFGRVIIESLACGTPVIASDRGGIKEAVDESCGIKIDISEESIAKTINYLYDHPRQLASMQKNCRQFAITNYSEKNAEKIFSHYT